jgi:addiction module HigA family antidote
MTPTFVHPGEHLAEELEAINMSAAELVRQLKLSKDRVMGILKCQRAITSDTALAARALFRDKRFILAQFAKSIRFEYRSGESPKRD